MIYNGFMGVNYSKTVAQVAKELGCTKSYVQKLIRSGRLYAELQDTPVKYYLINPASVEKYRNTPKNKGGRPRKEK